MPNVSVWMIIGCLGDKRLWTALCIPADADSGQCFNPLLLVTKARKNVHLHCLIPHNRYELPFIL